MSKRGLAKIYFRDVIETVSTLTGIDTDEMFVSGGSINKVCRNDKLGDSDIDIFFKTKKCSKLIMNDLNVISKHLNSHGNIYFRIKDINDDYQKINLVTMKHGKPVDVVNTFDLKCCMGWYDYETDEMNAYPNNDIINLNLSMIINPIATLQRVIKYIERGYKIYDNGYQIGKLLELISKKYKGDLSLDEFNNSWKHMDS